MNQANRYVNAFNDIVMQVARDSEGKKPKFIFRYPHKTRVVLEDMGNQKEVEYFVSKNEADAEKWDFWSKNGYYYKKYKSDGTFTEEIKDWTSHLCLSAMGVDMADINNDGNLDFFITDMLPEGDQRVN